MKGINNKYGTVHKFVFVSNLVDQAEVQQLGLENKVFKQVK